ncbi:MAG TPA: hypothetical protein VK625_10550 [Flavitalea sp.]|nr:hypothetical protein [Flavitalea sp.]
MSVIRQTLTYLKLSSRFLVRNPGISTALIVFRDYPGWLNHIKTGSNSVSAAIPWLTFGAIHAIKKKLKPDMKVFEYGSGGSTLFWASRVKSVISVEHDKAWFLKIKNDFQDRKITNVQYFLIEESPDPRFSEKIPSNPLDYISDDHNYAGYNFEQYAKKIDEYSDNYFDIVVVDGRARPSCIFHSLNKIKPSGYLIIDNSERDYYFSKIDFDKRNWKRIDYKGPVPFSNHFSQTSILQKIN